MARCGGEPAPAGFERWSGAGATFVYHDLRLRPRERIEVPGAEGAFRREATAGDTVLTFVFASHDARNHVALVVASTRSATGELDEDAILESLALE